MSMRIWIWIQPI